MFEPIILTGHINVGGIDASCQIREFRIAGDLDIIDTPPTMPHPHWKPKGGSSRWRVDVVYMSHPSVGINPVQSLTALLWDRIRTPPFELPFFGTFRPGEIDTDNPLWYGTMVVTSWGLGGRVADLAEDTVSYRLAGPPDRGVPALTDDDGNPLTDDDGNPLYM